VLSLRRRIAFVLRRRTAGYRRRKGQAPVKSEWEKAREIEQLVQSAIATGRELPPS
jgi:hypothetical protein